MKLTEKMHMLFGVLEAFIKVSQVADDSLKIHGRGCTIGTIQQNEHAKSPKVYSHDVGESQKYTHSAAQLREVCRNVPIRR